ncbi:MAG: hypothetical protein R3E96_03190 [Planctomycetota bacterium]
MTPAPLTARQRDILNFFREYLEENGISPTLEKSPCAGVNKGSHHLWSRRRARAQGVLKRAARGAASCNWWTKKNPPPAKPTSAPSRSSAPSPPGSPIETIEAREPELGELVPRGSEVYALRVQNAR